MKFRLLVILLLVACIISVSQAEAIGLAHGPLKHTFEAEKEINVDFKVIYFQDLDALDIVLAGGLTDYATMSELQEDGSFSIKIDLPADIPDPGTHVLTVSAYEVQPSAGMVGVDTRIINRIQVFVPFDGKYLEITSFEADNVVIGNPGKFRIGVENLGTDAITAAYAKVEIYDNLTQKKIATVQSDQIGLDSFESNGFEVRWPHPTQKNSIYDAKATVYFDGQSTQADTTFRVGELLVEVTDFSKQVQQAKTAPFEIQVESKWNEEITDVYARVMINESEFKSYPMDIEAWGSENMTAYVDASLFEVGAIVPVSIELHFNGETHATQGEVEIVEAKFSLSSPNVIYVLIAIALIIGIYVLKKININISVRKKV
ncbi:hypothetical protein HOD83_00095 [Candidatus Woesearchaeota archaeon]|jgi:hypothetical protein|nr:hypothetical protein [Candidatus Woesearchaeota archaeon]MBT4247980.1 hypothetical protein [Candidatus Woesearchaeota archaeon]